ncbi:hypothetical protein MPER_09748 [Moniliophthora perniciosa FA553]|nr:hypothetical protein MPER_09748 [Moniliophthora perniciosa FA553]
MSLIEQSVATVTNRTGVWQKDNGIQANDNDILENQGFIGGLGEAYERLASSDNLKNYTASFLAVQYNAVLELATEGQSNVYSGDWSGPPQSAPDVSSQAAASEVLIAGIRLGPGPNGSFTSTETSTTAEIETTTSAVSSQPSNPTVKSTPTGAIVGGVIGGVALIVVIALMSWIYRRRRRQNATAPLPFNAEQDNGNDGVRSPVDSRGRKHQEAVSSLEQTNAPPRNSLPPIEDMVRALYEQYRSEAPPSYRPGTS